mgnify:CR=1 FL=1
MSQESLPEWTETIIQALPEGALRESSIFRGQPALVIDAGSLLQVAKLLKEQFGFRYLIDVTALDQVSNEPRFYTVYHLLAHSTGAILRVKVPVEKEPPRVASVVDIWPAANWHERECFDLFGITFENHPDLRRILLPEGFEGHPLRKDYPVEGR